MRQILLAAVLLLVSGGISEAKNYQKVVCESEPDPVRCKQIEMWYVNAVNNSGGGCCGLGDAYWADQVDKVTPMGIFLTVTDKRDCTKESAPKFTEDDEGNYIELDPNAPGDCIPGRINMDGRKLFVQSKDIDHFLKACPTFEGDTKTCRQGNPTGHTVVFLQARGTTYYDGGEIDGVRTAWPTVLCFFPGFDN